jgi:hypothetical protein
MHISSSVEQCKTEPTAGQKKILDLLNLLKLLETFPFQSLISGKTDDSRSDSDSDDEDSEDLSSDNKKRK